MGTRFDAGDHIVAVRWYERVTTDPERRTFEIGGDEVCFFNSTELRCRNVQMELHSGPALRARRGAAATSALATCAAAESKEPQRQYRLLRDIEIDILKHCR